MNKADRFAAPDQDPLKKKFLQGTLQEEGEFIIDFQDEVIDRYLQEHKGTLRRMRGFKVQPSGEGFRLDIHFVKYLRFHDIQGKEGVPKDQLMLYNRLIYGRLSSIASVIQFGYTDEIKALMAKYYEPEIQL